MKPDTTTKPRPKTKARRASTKAKAAPRRLSRPLLDNMLHDLAERIHRHIGVVEAIETANTPNGQHTVIEHQLRTVFGLMLDHQLHSLRDIRRFADILCSDQVRP